MSDFSTLFALWGALGAAAFSLSMTVYLLATRPHRDFIASQEELEATLQGLREERKALCREWEEWYEKLAKSENRIRLERRRAEKRDEKEGALEAAAPAPGPQIVSVDQRRRAILDRWRAQRQAGG